MFSCEFCEIFKTYIVIEQLRAIVSIDTNQLAGFYMTEQEKKSYRSGGYFFLVVLKLHN